MKKKDAPSCGHFNIDLSCEICGELADYWTMILEASGLDDAEHIKHGEVVLKQPQSMITPKALALKVSGDKLYKKDGVFKQVGSSDAWSSEKAQLDDQFKACIKNEDWKDPVDKLVMIRHVQGKLIKDISQELKDRGYNKNHRQTIRFIIRKYELKWKIKNWKPEQLKLKPWKPKT